jgi:hypothetical protein
MLASYSTAIRGATGNWATLWTNGQSGSAALSGGVEISGLSTAAIYIIAAACLQNGFRDCDGGGALIAFIQARRLPQTSLRKIAHEYVQCCHSSN